jgi:hypothetical protein
VVACTFNNNQCWYKRTNKWIAGIKIDGVKQEAMSLQFLAAYIHTTTPQPSTISTSQ